MNDSNTHLQDEELILLHYRDGKDLSRVEEHLQSCSECRIRFEKLDNLLGSISVPEPPPRPANYGTDVWNRIRADLPDLPRRRQWWSWSSPPLRWAAAGALAALLALAFMLGRYSRPAQPGVTSVTKLSPKQAKEKVLLVAVGDHLDRSQMLLLELAHASGEGEIDISDEQQHALELASANRLYRATALQVGDKRMASVLDDLERVLLEIGHQPAKVSASDLEQVQKRIQTQGILFKVRVTRTKVRDEIRAPLPETAPSRGKGQTT
jgi:hypothetical protein